MVLVLMVLVLVLRDAGGAAWMVGGGRWLGGTRVLSCLRVVDGGWVALTFCPV